MTVGMLLATILLVLTFSGVLSGAWERLGIRPRTAGAWLLAMLAALLCASVSTALAEIVRRTAIFLLTPPGVKGGHRG